MFSWSATQEHAQHTVNIVQSHWLDFSTMFTSEFSLSHHCCAKPGYQYLAMLTGVHSQKIANTKGSMFLKKQNVTKTKHTHTNTGCLFTIYCGMIKSNEWDKHTMCLALSHNSCWKGSKCKGYFTLAIMALYPLNTVTVLNLYTVYTKLNVNSAKWVLWCSQKFSIQSCVQLPLQTQFMPCKHDAARNLLGIGGVHTVLLLIPGRSTHGHR